LLSCLVDDSLTLYSRPSPRFLACHPHLLATPVTVRVRLLLVVVAAVVTAHPLRMTTTETVGVVLLAVPVVTALAVMTTIAAEVPHLATTTTAEIPTLVLLHPVLAALQ
jgi:hypothetical protein